VLLPGLDLYYTAFSELSTDRQMGMAEGWIPWSSIDRYARRHDLTDWDFDRFRILIRGMDVEYIKYREEQAKIEKGRIKRG